MPSHPVSPISLLGGWPSASLTVPFGVMALLLWRHQGRTTDEASTAHMPTTDASPMPLSTSDVVAAGAITIATEVLFGTSKNNSTPRWQEHPPTVVEALRFCANICRSECGEAAEDARVALMESKAAAGFVGILGNDFARHAGADESEKICVQVCAWIRKRS